MIRRTVLAFALLIATMTSVSHATWVQPFSMTSLALESHHIVRGFVEQVEVVYDPVWERNYTLSTIRVLETLDGADGPGDTIVVRQLGGELDGFETRIVGNAILNLESEVVIFARTDGAFHYLVGMSQGKYEVIRDIGQPPVVTRTREGITFFSPLPMRPMKDHLKLEDLRHEVTSALGGKK